MTPQSDKELSDKEKAAANATAAKWFARLQSPDVNETDRDEFRVWIGQSKEHAAAYENVRRFWNVSPSLIDELPMLDLPEKKKIHFFWPLTGFQQIAAALVVAGLLSLFLGWPILSSLTFKPSPHTVNIVVKGVEYASGPQFRSSVLLPDGSLMVLNRKSKARIQYSPLAREITLLEGQAHFEVAKHKPQAFYVYAENSRVRATGTTFDVSINGRDQSIEVALAEGSVVVDEPAGPSERSSVSKTLAAGQTLVVREGRPPQVSATVPRQEQNWRADRLILSGTSLRQVVAALNRYGGAQIILNDENLGDLKIDGTLRTDEPIAMARAIAEIYSLKFTKVNNKNAQLSWK